MKKWQISGFLALEEEQVRLDRERLNRQSVRCRESAGNAVCVLNHYGGNPEEQKEQTREQERIQADTRKSRMQ